jgi:hypothetical protein
VCSGGFFVVRYKTTHCAAFKILGSAKLKEGDVVQGQFDRVGSMVMKHVERNEEFEVFSHTGESGLIACLLLIEHLQLGLNAAHTQSTTEERAFQIFFNESFFGSDEISTTIPGLL